MEKMHLHVDFLCLLLCLSHGAIHATHGKNKVQQIVQIDFKALISKKFLSVNSMTPHFMLTRDEKKTLWSVFLQRQADVTTPHATFNFARRLSIGNIVAIYFIVNGGVKSIHSTRMCNTETNTNQSNRVYVLRFTANDLMVTDHFEPILFISFFSLLFFSIPFDVQFTFGENEREKTRERKRERKAVPGNWAQWNSFFLRGFNLHLVDDPAYRAIVSVFPSLLPCSVSNYFVSLNRFFDERASAEQFGKQRFFHMMTSTFLCILVHFIVIFLRK